MVTKLLNLIGINHKTANKTVFFSLSARDKKKIIKKAIHSANKEQKTLVDEVKKRRFLKK
jgi:hypothetical protein